MKVAAASSSSSFRPPAVPLPGMRRTKSSKKAVKPVFATTSFLSLSLSFSLRSDEHEKGSFCRFFCEMLLLFKGHTTFPLTLVASGVTDRKSRLITAK